MSLNPTSVTRISNHFSVTTQNIPEQINYFFKKKFKSVPVCTKEIYRRKRVTAPLIFNLNASW